MRAATLPLTIIDKLISDSERPEHSLKKTLGPLSLTAMGVGIVIGSGIFTVIGTAIAVTTADRGTALLVPEDEQELGFFWVGHGVLVST